MSRRGIYLYGMVRPGALGTLDVVGVEEGQPVEVIEIDDLAAVVSAVELDPFEAALVAGEPDPGWIVPRAVRHEQVIEAVMTGSPVLPVRFGALFTSTHALKGLVADHRDEIRRFLDRISDKEEWAFKGFVDLDRFVDWLLEHDPPLSARYQQLAATPGTRYFQEKRLRDDARKQTKRLGQTIAAQVVDALESAGAEVLRLPPRSQEGDPREVLLHLACLMPRGAVPDILERAREAASARGEPLLVLELSGPWPPFHFCPSLEERPA